MEQEKKPNIVFRILDKIEVALGPIVLLVIFVDVFLQVLSRVIPGNAIAWTVELGEILLGALIWFGIGIGVTKNSHVGFDLLVSRFSPRWKKIFSLWNLNLFIVYLALLGVFTIQLLQSYLELSFKSTILQIGMFWVRLPILIGCVLTIIRLVIKEIRVLKDKEQMYTQSVDALE
jgi:TRAP-type C4-dicarboxylate transport system permease small subunit